jgi:hypothetical protein
MTVSEDKENNLAEAINYSTKGMTSSQRKRFSDNLSKRLPEVINEERQSALEGELQEYDEDLLAQYNKQLKDIRQGDVRAIDALKKAYRRKGLSIW